MSETRDTVYTPFVTRRLSLIIPPKKAKKLTSRQKSNIKGRKNTGALKGFTDPPLDIIYEMVKFLEPKDLLNLIRTTKDFRALLTSRSALPIWKMVLSRVVPTLPPCPQDLCEMEYASLLFDTFCMACLSTRGSIETDFKVRLRLCSTCKKNNIRPPRDYCEKYDYSVLQDACKLLSPSFEDELPESADDNDLGEPYDSSGNKLYDSYFKPEALIILNELTRLKSLDNPSVYEKFVSEQKAVATKMMNEGRELALWKSNAEMAQIDQQMQALHRREERIKQKMSELGWEERYYPKSRHPLNKDQREADYREWCNYLYQRKEFSLRSWNMHLPRLRQLYERSKRVIQIDELSERVSSQYLAFRKAQPLEARGFMPNWAEVSMLPIASDFMEKNHVECADDAIQALLPRLVEAAVADFRPKALHDLMEIVPAPTNASPLDEISDASSVPNSMKNVRSLFSCNCPNCRLFIVVSASYETSIFTYSEFLDHITTKMPIHPWQRVKPKADLLLQEVVDDILDLFEIPVGSSLEEVEESRTFRCQCDQPGAQGPLSFRKLVEHVYRHRKWILKMSSSAQEKSRPLLDTLLYDSHSTERLKVLLIASPSDAQCASMGGLDNQGKNLDPSSTSGTRVPSDMVCRSCYRLTLSDFGINTKDTMEYHMKYRHGKTLEPGDFATCSALRNLYGSEMPVA
ncbi:hypothetical protein CPC08DRAFT_748923 [Agrocybe pediades]|nr:hypothetical protein CPC08DRAFT_748923 [Agrocybe pediades]